MYTIMFLSFLFCIGIFGMVQPKRALHVRDFFRLKGDRHYTDWAIQSTIIGGLILATISGTALFFYVQDLLQ